MFDQALTNWCHHISYSFTHAGVNELGVLEEQVTVQLVKYGCGDGMIHNGIQ